VDQRPKKGVQLQQVFSNVGFEPYQVIKLSAATVLVSPDILFWDSLAPTDFVNEPILGRFEHLQPWQRHLNELPLDGLY
jgi:hypothetical protein